MGDRWTASIGAAVSAAELELLGQFPGSQVSIREVQDERGVVAVVVTVGDGRLIVGARSVDLAPIRWPWPDGLVSVVGLWPRQEMPTVAELVAGLVEVAA